MVYWDGDGRKDLLVGLADGRVAIYLNTATDESPEFDGGTFLQVGAPGSKVDIDVGSRATSTTIDWNNDAKKDLVVGALDGYVRFFINEGTDTAPDFLAQQFVQNSGGNLLVPSNRASPHVVDWDEDGMKDLLAGNTNGQLLFYSNTASDSAPSFSGYVQVESDGVPIDLAGTPRSRPFVYDWTADGLPDVLLGSGDGLVRLYQGFDPTSVAWESLAVPDPTMRVLSPYPNPFNPEVTIPVVLSAEQHLRLSVHDVTGRRISMLVDGFLDEGSHLLSWHGLDQNKRAVPSGVYFLWIKSPGLSTSEKLVLLR